MTHQQPSAPTRFRDEPKQQPIVIYGKSLASFMSQKVYHANRHRFLLALFFPN
jgi:hypothetical protein